MIKYSIIVCSYNRYNFLIETIESVLTVLKNRSDFELLVIDNNSPDETSSIKEKYVLNTAVKYFLETQQGLSHARNRGIKEAVGEILVYLDDDIELVESYFETCDTIFSDASISISGGKVLPFKVEIPKWLPKKYYFLVSIYDLGDSAKYVKYLMGGNFAIRKNVALDIGFYNVELGRNRKKLAAGEEIDYQNRASLKGYKNYYHPDQNILHKINDKLNEEYVLTYSKELGRSERLIDALGSPLKVTIKIMKSYVAILLYKMFFDVITGEKRKKYLSIIYKYAEGYINKKIKVLKVGIDAKWYFDGPASGKMVIRNLVNEICKLNNDKISFYIILDKKHKNVKLDFENAKIEKVYVWNKNNLLSNVFCIPYIAKKYDLDVVLYQTSVSCFGTHKKIAYIHDLIYVSHPQYYTLIERLYLKPVKFLTRFSDFIITVSDFERTRFKQLNFSNKEIKVLHHGFDPKFKLKTEFSLKSLNDTKIKYRLPDSFVLYVGRINTRKNVPSLIRAFSKLNHSTNLVLVGNKEWKTDDIDSLILELNLSDRIIQTGPVFGDDLAKIYALSTIFCFPSFEESFGLPPLEAMASGIPVVVSNTSSLPEVCGNAAVYVDATNSAEITKAISDLLSDDNMYLKYKEFSVERAKAFSWSRTTLGLIDILESRYT